MVKLRTGAVEADLGEACLFVMWYEVEADLYGSAKASSTNIMPILIPKFPHLSLPSKLLPTTPAPKKQAFPQLRLEAKLAVIDV